MDDEALNYDSLATVPSWGTEEGATDCIFAWGCMDPNALNYDATAVAAKETELKNKAEQDAQDIIDNKASGKAKLKELGLTDAEIKALIGV